MKQKIIKKTELNRLFSTSATDNKGTQTKLISYKDIISIENLYKGLSTGNFKLGKKNLTLSVSVMDPIEGSYKSNIKSEMTCQWPHCDRTLDLEEHHINPVRNINGKRKNLSEYQVWLRKKQRQTVTLCREHHFEVEKLSRLK